LTRYIFCTLIICLCLCCSCAGTLIAKEDYSKLTKAQETFQFAQKAISNDDPDAFYYCLAGRTKRVISLEDLKFGWALAGSFFNVILSAKIKDLEMPAPEKIFRGNPNTAKITLESQGVKAYLLLHKEDDKWLILYPSPYPLPDLSKFKKLERLPWRSDKYAFYESTPVDWVFKTKEKVRKYRKERLRYPQFRTE
jgi:hypothetical protein